MAAITMSPTELLNRLTSSHELDLIRRIAESYGLDYDDIVANHATKEAKQGESLIISRNTKTNKTHKRKECALPQECRCQALVWGKGTYPQCSRRSSGEGEYGHFCGTHSRQMIEKGSLTNGTVDFPPEKALKRMQKSSVNDSETSPKKSTKSSDKSPDKSPDKKAKKTNKKQKKPEKKKTKAKKLHISPKADVEEDDTSVSQVVEEPAAPKVVEEPAAPEVVEEPAADEVVEEPQSDSDDDEDVAVSQSVSGDSAVVAETAAESEQAPPKKKRVIKKRGAD